MSEVEVQGLQIMHSLTQTIRNAESINSPSTGANSPNLSLNTIISGNNPTVFDIGSGAIRIKEGGSSAIPLSNYRVTASGLSFLNLSRSSTPGAIRISFTLASSVNNGKNEYVYTKNFVGSATLRQP